MNNLFKKTINTLIKTLNKKSNCESTPSENKDMFAEIESRLSTIENKQNDIQKVVIEKCWNIEKVLVEKLETEKVEFSFETIDVNELSGMLSIGINSDCELVKKEQNFKSNTTKKKHYKNNNKHSPVNGKPPKINITYNNK